MVWLFIQVWYNWFINIVAALENPDEYCVDLNAKLKPKI